MASKASVLPVTAAARLTIVSHESLNVTIGCQAKRTCPVKRCVSMVAEHVSLVRPAAGTLNQHPDALFVIIILGTASQIEQFALLVVK